MYWGANMRKTAALIVLAGATLGAQDATACSGSLLELNNQETGGHLMVQSGVACGIRLSAFGPVHSQAIVKRPANGQAGIGSAGMVVYRSRPGFVGKDEFIYVRRGLDPWNKPMTRTVRITVDMTR
jgi:hypothetical protein